MLFILKQSLPRPYEFNDLDILTSCPGDLPPLAVPVIWQEVRLQGQTVGDRRFRMYTYTRTPALCDRRDALPRNVEMWRAASGP